MFCFRTESIESKKFQRYLKTSPKTIEKFGILKNFRKTSTPICLPLLVAAFTKNFLTHTDSLLSPLLSRNKAFHDNVQSCNFFLENHVQRCDTTTVAGILVTQKSDKSLQPYLSNLFTFYHLISPQVKIFSKRVVL